MEVKFINYQKDYLRFKKEYDAAWESVNMRGDLILRRDVEEFEKRLADYIGTKYAVAVSSGTDALYLALQALQLSGKRIAVPSHTFKATVGAVVKTGAIPVIYDMDEDWRYEEECFAQIPAHIAGELSEIFDAGIPVIEDACQAFGAIKNPFTSAQCFSFYPAKISGCKGDAGAVTTNDEEIYDYIKNARDHFKKDNRDFGGNHRMDNLQAALLNAKIQHIDEILNRRKEIAEMYLEKLENIELPNNQLGRVWQDFIVRTEKRNELYEYLKQEGIETIKNVYPFSPQYPKLPLAARYEAETLRIPCNENLTDEEIKYVIEKINLWSK